MPLPEAPARKKIDQLLLAADWHACNIGHATIHAARSGAIQFAHRIISKAQLKRVPFTSIGIEQLYIVVEIEKRFFCFDEDKLKHYKAIVEDCLSLLRGTDAKFDINLLRAECIKQALMASALSGYSQ